MNEGKEDKSGHKLRISPCSFILQFDSPLSPMKTIIPFLDIELNMETGLGWWLK
jgi:hypothetical protein